MHIRPSEIMGIDDVYTAFCFDEACAFIISEIQDGKEPIIGPKNKDSKGTTLNKPSDLYNKYISS